MNDKFRAYLDMLKSVQDEMNEKMAAYEKELMKLKKEVNQFSKKIKKGEKL